MKSIVPHSDTPQMMLCTICPKPGFCCTGLVLSNVSGTLWFKKDSWKIEAKKFLESCGLEMFEPYGVVGESASGMVAPSFRFNKLTSEGRCGIYSSRPQLCRDYEPMSDHLCCFVKEPK